MKRADIKAGLFCVIITLLLCMQCDVNLFYNGDSNTDSSVFRYMAFAASKGQVWYRDCFDHKGPLVYFYNWLGMQISYWRGVWCVEYMSMLAAVCIAYKTARLACSELLSCGCVLLAFTMLFDCFEGGNYVEEYALPFVMMALYIFIDYFLNQVINNIRLCICGACMGGVCLLRPDMIAVWCVFCIAVLVQNIYFKTYKRIGYFICFFLIGFLIMIAPFAVYLLVNDALQDWIDCYLSFNFIYAGGGSKQRVWINMKDSLKNQVMLISIIAMVYCSCKKEKRGFHITYLCYIILGMYMTYMSGYHGVNSHYAIALVPIYVYPMARFLGYCKKWVVRNDSKFIFAVILLIAFPVWVDSAESIITSIANSDGRDANIQVLVDEIEENSNEMDKITVVGNRDILYVLSRRISASRYSYQTPIVEKDSSILDEYMQDINENMPKLVIVMEQCEVSEAMADFIQQNDYEQIYVNERYGYYIYKKC